MASPPATATTATTRLLSSLQIPVEPKPQRNRITLYGGITSRDRGVVLKGLKRLAASKGIQDSGPDGLNSLGREKLLGLLQLILYREEKCKVLKKSYGTLAAKLDCSEKIIKAILPIGQKLGLIQMELDHGLQLYSFYSGPALEPAFWSEVLKHGDAEVDLQITRNTKEDKDGRPGIRQWESFRRRGAPRIQKPRPEPLPPIPASTGVLPSTSGTRQIDTPRLLLGSTHKYPINQVVPKEHLDAPRSNQELLLGASRTSQVLQVEVEPQVSALAGSDPAHIPANSQQPEQPGQEDQDNHHHGTDGVADEPGPSGRSLRSLPAGPGTNNSQQPMQLKLINGISNPLNVEPGDTVQRGTTSFEVLNAFQWDTDDYWCRNVETGETCWINATQLTV